jgi:hypothetical protein
MQELINPKSNSRQSENNTQCWPYFPDMAPLAFPPSVFPGSCFTVSIITTPGFMLLRNLRADLGLLYYQCNPLAYFQNDKKIVRTKAIRPLK